VLYLVNGVSGDGIAIQALHKRLIDHDGDIARSHFNARENLKSHFLWHLLSRKFTEQK